MAKEEAGRLARELFAGGELAEAERRWRACAHSASREQRRWEAEGSMLKAAVNASLDRDQSARELLAELLARAELSEEGAALGFASLLHSLPDLVLDVPDAPAQLALFLARAVVDRVLLSLHSVSHHVASAASDSSPYSADDEASPERVLRTASHILQTARGPERVSLAWGGHHSTRTTTAKLRFRVALDEFRTSLDVEEVARIVRESNLPHFAHEAVRQAIILALEHESLKDPVVRLLEHLSSTNAVSHSQLDKGLQIAATMLTDLEKDIPKIKERYAAVVSRISSISSSWSTFRQTNCLGRLASTSDLSVHHGNQAQRRVEDEMTLGSFSKVGARGHSLETLAHASTAKLGQGLQLSRFRHKDERLQVTPQIDDGVPSSTLSIAAITAPANAMHKSASTPSGLKLADTELVKPEARARNDGAFEAVYKLEEDVLGTGGFAVVRPARHRKTNKEYAVKMIAIAEDNEGDEEGSDSDSDGDGGSGPSAMELQQIQNELALLVRAGQHHAIASIYEYFLLERACLIVMDLLQGDELIVELCSRCGGFSERDVALSMRQVFSAVDYIHSLSIAHRDLKAENFHLRLPKELESATLVDFGLAKAIQSSQKLTVPVGTPEYAGASSMCVSLTAPTFAQAFLVLF